MATDAPVPERQGGPRRRGPSAFGWLSLGLCALIGVAIGIGSFTFVYAKGASYLTDEPSACANCHIMREQYSGWTHSSHHAVAVCNDRHTPPGFVGKYLSKARNGWHHPVAFTAGASTRRRRPRASWGSRWTWRGRGNWRCGRRTTRRTSSRAPHRW